MSPDTTVAAFRLPRTCFLVGCLSLAWLAPCSAATLDDAHKLYNTGEFDDCTAACEAAIEQNQWQLAWRLLKIRASWPPAATPMPWPPTKRP